MKTNEIREVIKERERISVETQDNWGDGIEQCWNKLITIISENINDSIEFILNECAEEEFSWLSEVIDDVIEVTKNKDLLEAYKSLVKKYPEECKKYNILGVIQYAESWLEDDE